MENLGFLLVALVCPISIGLMMLFRVKARRTAATAGEMNSRRRRTLMHPPARGGQEEGEAAPL